VERRREPRFAAGQTVRLIVLDRNGNSADRQIDAEVTEISGKGVRLRVAERIAVGDAVRLDMEDNAILGEVCHCSETGNGFICGVEVDQILSHVSDLARLMDALLGGHTPADVQNAMQTIRRR
jgi:hypothetical protein